MQVDGRDTFTTGTKWAKPRLKNTLIISWYHVSLQTCTKHCQKGFVHLSLVHRLAPYQTGWQIALHRVASHAHNVNCVLALVNEHDLSLYPFTGIKPNRQQRLFPYDQRYFVRHLGSIRLCRNLDTGSNNLRPNQPHHKPPWIDSILGGFFVPMGKRASETGSHFASLFWSQCLSWVTLLDASMHHRRAFES